MSVEEDTPEYLRCAMVPSCAVDDIEMTPELLRYLVAFCSYASKRNSNQCWAKQSKIATRMGVTRQAVSNAAKRLAELGYIAYEHAFDPEDGHQLSNTYTVDLNKTIPPERDRSAQPRKRAGIGGKPTHKTPATLRVAPPSTPRVAPPATAGVAPPTTQGVAPLNTEVEDGKGKRKGKRARAAAADPPTFNQWQKLPQSQMARAWRNGQPPRYSDLVREYNRQLESGALG